MDKLQEDMKQLRLKYENLRKSQTEATKENEDQNELVDETNIQEGMNQRLSELCIEVLQYPKLTQVQNDKFSLNFSWNDYSRRTHPNGAKGSGWKLKKIPWSAKTSNYEDKSRNWRNNWTRSD